MADSIITEAATEPAPELELAAEPPTQAEGGATDHLFAAIDLSTLSPEVRGQVAALMASLGDAVQVGPELRQRLLAAAAGPLAERRAERVATRRAVQAGRDNTTPPLGVVPERFYEAAAEAWNSVANVYDLTVDQTDDRLRAAVVAVLRLIDADRPTAPRGVIGGIEPREATGSVIDDINAAMRTIAERPEYRTPDDMYQQAARAMLAVPGGPDLFEWRQCPTCPRPFDLCSCAGVPYPSAAVRAAVDAGREDLTRRIAELEEAVRQMTFERDLACDVADQARAERDVQQARADRLIQQLADLQGQLAITKGGNT